MDRSQYHTLRRRLAELMAQHCLLQRGVNSDPYPKLAQREATASLRSAQDVARQIRPARDAYTAEVNQRWADLQRRLSNHVQLLARQRRVARDMAGWGVYCQQNRLSRLERALGNMGIEWGGDTLADRITVIEAGRAAAAVAA